MRRHKTPILTTALTLLALYALPATAQRAGEVLGGDLPQQYSNDITNKFDLMRVEEMLADPAALEALYTAEQLEAFFANSVVRVSLYPDGSVAAYAREGGEIAALRLGRKPVDLGSDGWTTDRWVLRAGEYAPPKRSVPVKLELAAGGNNVAVECMNRFERLDRTVTFYVGPMNGLRCIGLVDEDALPFQEVMRTADGQGSATPSSPGS